MDGFLDVWDFFYRQNEVAYSQKVSDAVLTTIQINGSMAAIGDSDGTVSMMSMCRTLYDHTLNPREKEIMGTIFERETRREKNLDTAKRQAEKMQKPAKEKVNKDKVAQQQATMLAELNEKFFAAVSDGDDEMKAFIQARGQVDDEPGQDGGAVQVA
jgi:dynein intermediate chain 2